MINSAIQPNQEIELNKVSFKNAIVSEIELTNGFKTKVITIFNANEVHFEEMIIGVNTAIYRQAEYHNNIKSVQNTFSNIENAVLKPFATYFKNELY